MEIPETFEGNITGFLRVDNVAGVEKLCFQAVTMMKVRDDLDLYKLEVFYWVAELGSFSRAADHLSLRQPPVSAHIQELEAKLGSNILPTFLTASIMY